MRYFIRQFLQIRSVQFQPSQIGHICHPIRECVFLFRGKNCENPSEGFIRYFIMGSDRVKGEYKPENHFVKSQLLEQMAEFRPPSLLIFGWSVIRIVAPSCLRAHSINGYIHSGNLRKKVFCEQSNITIRKWLCQPVIYTCLHHDSLNDMQNSGIFKTVKSRAGSIPE